MRWSDAHAVVEGLRRETQLYLPALTTRRGFSSSRVEHLLNRLVAAMPEAEAYMEVGTLEGRTLEAAATGNPTKRCYGCDPGKKYLRDPEPFPRWVRFFAEPWERALTLAEGPIGLAFYDGDHSAESTSAFMLNARECLADSAVLVIDDWDRASVRDGAYTAAMLDDRWRLLREMPEYTDGLTGPGMRFGYFFGVSVWGWKR